MLSPVVVFVMWGKLVSLWGALTSPQCDRCLCSEREGKFCGSLRMFQQVCEGGGGEPREWIFL